MPYKWRGGEYGYVSAWLHPACAQLPEECQVPLMIYGLDSLEEKDQAPTVKELKCRELPSTIARVDPNGDVAYFFWLHLSLLSHPTLILLSVFSFFKDPNFVPVRTMKRMKQPKSIRVKLLPVILITSPIRGGVENS
jgi:hypothetical protein